MKLVQSQHRTPSLSATADQGGTHSASHQRDMLKEHDDLKHFERSFEESKWRVVAYCILMRVLIRVEERYNIQRGVGRTVGCIRIGREDALIACRRGMHSFDCSLKMFDTSTAVQASTSKITDRNPIPDLLLLITFVSTELLHQFDTDQTSYFATDLESRWLISRILHRGWRLEAIEFTQFGSLDVATQNQCRISRSTTTTSICLILEAGLFLDEQSAQY